MGCNWKMYDFFIYWICIPFDNHYSQQQDFFSFFVTNVPIWKDHFACLADCLLFHCIALYIKDQKVGWLRFDNNGIVLKVCVLHNSTFLMEWTRILSNVFSWWYHQMKVCPTFLVLCEGNPPITGGFPSYRPMRRSFDVFYLRPKNCLSKQSRRQWLETPSRSLWCHCNVFGALVTVESTTGLPMAWCPWVLSSHERHGSSKHKQLDTLLNSYISRL